MDRHVHRESLYDDLAKSLCALLLPHVVPLAPAELLKMIQCICSSIQPCSSLRCGCVSGQLPCSLFWSDSCCNQMTNNNMANDANDDEEHSDDEDEDDDWLSYEQQCSIIYN